MKTNLTVIISFFLICILIIILLLIVSCGGSTITATATATVSKTVTTSSMIAITVTTTVTTTTIPTKILIPDANLDAAISEELYMSDRPIYISDLETLTSLEAPGRYISNLTGLEYCIKLQILEISQNSISDLSPLRWLPSLKILDLRRNNISDISPLVESSGLGQGDKVNLKNNNLDLTEGSDDMQNIRALEDKGVEVDY